MLDKKILEEIVLTSPLVLLCIEDKETIDLANNYLPYSTGFELECEMKDSYNRKTFKSIPNIIFDSIQDACEQRYRIPNGVNGLICLYNICYHLGNNSLLNMGSGIHYHVDCTETKPADLCSVVDDDYISGLLCELDAWEYGGTYNRRGINISTHSLRPVGNWIRWNSSHCTLEFRIGNMSFDYGVLVKQIIHANDIVRRWKNRIVGYNNIIRYSEIKYKEQVAYQKLIDIGVTSYEHKIRMLNERLNVPSELVVNSNITEDAKQFIKKRVHKLY